MIDNIIKETIAKIPKKQLTHSILDMVWDKAEQYNKEVLTKRKLQEAETKQLKKDITELLKRLEK